MGNDQSKANNKDKKIYVTQEEITKDLWYGCLVGDYRLVKLRIENNNLDVEELNKKYYLLHDACSKGYFDITTLLLASGAEVNLQNEDGEFALTLAGRNGDAKVVHALLKARAQVDAQNLNGWSSLLNASYNGHVAAAKVLLEQGAQVNLQGNDGASALILASRYGHVQLVEILLEKGAYVNRQKKDGWTALMLAIQNGHVEVVHKLLKEGAWVNFKMKDEWSALMLASQNGHVAVGKMLLKKGAQVDLQKKNGVSALILASQNGHGEFVKLLLQYRAQVDQQAENGWSALALASSEGHAEVGEILLGKSAQVDLQDNDGWSPLMMASNHGHTEMVKILLKNQAQVNLQDNHGRSALTLASQHGKTEVVKILLENGAQVDLQTKDGWSALMLASQNGHVEATMILLKNRAQVNLQDNDGWSALLLASQYGQTEVVKMFKNKAQVDLRMKGGRSALMLASQNGHVGAAEALLENGAQVDLQDKEGWFALVMASATGQIKVVELLLEKKAQVDQQMNNGWSALMAACQKEHFGVVEILLKNGAQVNLKGENGNCALQIASQNGQTEAVKALLENGAQVDLQANDGWSALMHASCKGHLEATKILLANGAQMNLQGNDGASALMLASKNGHVEVIKLLLLKSDLEIDLQMTAGSAQVTMISPNDYFSQLLDAMKKRSSGEISKYFDRLQNPMQRIEVKILLENGKEIILKNSVILANTITARESSRLMSMLQAKGARTYHQVKYSTVSDITIYHSNDNVTHIRTESDTKMTVFKCEWSALMIACGSGHFEVARLLLEHGANVNLQTEDGQTALMIACAGQKREIVQLLLENQAQVDLRTTHNHSALSLAENGRNKNVMHCHGLLDDTQFESNPPLDDHKLLDADSKEINTYGDESTSFPSTPDKPDTTVQHKPTSTISATPSRLLAHSQSESTSRSSTARRQLTHSQSASTCRPGWFDEPKFELNPPVNVKKFIAVDKPIIDERGPISSIDKAGYFTHKSKSASTLVDTGSSQLLHSQSESRIRPLHSNTASTHSGAGSINRSEWLTESKLPTLNENSILDAAKTNGNTSNEESTVLTPNKHGDVTDSTDTLGATPDRPQTHSQSRSTHRSNTSDKPLTDSPYESTSRPITPDEPTAHSPSKPTYQPNTSDEPLTDSSSEPISRPITPDRPPVHSEAESSSESELSYESKELSQDAKLLAVDNPIDNTSDEHSALHTTDKFGGITDQHKKLAAHCQSESTSTSVTPDRSPADSPAESTRPAAPVRPGSFHQIKTKLNTQTTSSDDTSTWTPVTPARSLSHSQSQSTWTPVTPARSLSHSQSQSTWTPVTPARSLSHSQSQSTWTPVTPARSLSHSQSQSSSISVTPDISPDASDKPPASLSEPISKPITRARKFRKNKVKQHLVVDKPKDNMSDKLNALPTSDIRDDFTDEHKPNSTFTATPDRRLAHPQSESTHSIANGSEGRRPPSFNTILSQRNITSQHSTHNQKPFKTSILSTCLKMSSCLVLTASIGILILAIVFPQNRYTPTDSRSLKLDSKPKLKQFLHFQPLNEPRVINIIEEITPSCQDIGILLELEPIKIDIIWKMTSTSKPTDRCRDTIRLWLEGQGSEPVTWETFIRVLQALKLLELAKQIRKTFE